MQARAALAQATTAVTQAQQALVQARAAAGRGGGGGGAGGGRGNNQPAPPDFTSVQPVDDLVPPQFTGDDDFFAFLLGTAPVEFVELKAKADKGDVLPTFSLPGVKVTISIDNSYDVVSTQLSKNVVGLIDGTDAALKNTYVVFGAHLDHLGYRTAPQGGRGGQVPDAAADLIFNGADDDGSGITAELAIAKAFAVGPKPKRSVVFVWHTGEEAGLFGSRYNADFPVIPLDKVQCLLNLDMVGRNADNDPRNADQLYIVGGDRISSDLHNLIVDVNSAQSKPLRLDYAWNDPPIPSDSISGAITTATPPRGSRLRFSPPDCIRTTTRCPIRLTRSCSTRWRASHSSSTRRVSAWRTPTRFSSGITRDHGAAKGSRARSGGSSTLRKVHEVRGWAARAPSAPRASCALREQSA